MKISARRFARQFLMLPFITKVAIGRRLCLLSSTEIAVRDTKNDMKTSLKIFARAKAENKLDALYEATWEEYEKATTMIEEWRR